MLWNQCAVESALLWDEECCGTRVAAAFGSCFFNKTITRWGGLGVGVESNLAFFQAFQHFLKLFQFFLNRRSQAKRSIYKKISKLPINRSAANVIKFLYDLFMYFC